MMRKPRAAKAIALVATVAGSALVLALAGPAAAHHHGDHPSFGGHDPAGTIASFDPSTGNLLINLAGGGTASGEVTDFTWIQCGDWHPGWHGRHRGRQLHHFDGDHGHSWGDPDCTSDDLTEGTVVDEAILGLRDGRAFFWKVELDN
jgi:hypothetical protein